MNINNGKIIYSYDLNLKIAEFLNIKKKDADISTKEEKAIKTDAKEVSESISDTKKSTTKKTEEKKGIKIYLGYLDDEKYTDKNDWYEWRWDVNVAEAILVYKYAPCYNSSLKGDYPKLSPYKAVQLLHSGKKRRLQETDNAPKDYRN